MFKIFAKKKGGFVPVGVEVYFKSCTTKTIKLCYEMDAIYLIVGSIKHVGKWL